MTNPVEYRLSPVELSELPSSCKEDNHQRFRYHFFLGYSFSKYSVLLPAEKDASFFDKDSLFDPTDTPLLSILPSLCATQKKAGWTYLTPKNINGICVFLC